MTTLREIMTRDPVTVGPEATLRELVELLTNRSISGVPVVTGSGEVVGVISATNVLSFTASTPAIPSDRSESLAEWGEEPDTSDEDDESTPEFYAELWADSEADVLTRVDGATSPEWDLLEEHTVSEVMSRRLQSVPIDADLPTVARRMIRAGVHRLLVLEDKHLVGLVTTTDFVRAVAERRIPA